MKTIKLNKHVFVWVGSFLLGSFGIDRLMRGQIGACICKLLFNIFTLGVWSAIDFYVAVYKCYAANSDQTYITFEGGHYKD